MPVQVGDQLPDVPVWVVSPGEADRQSARQALGRGKVVLFGVPGAFTPTCSDYHLPGFVIRSEELGAKGVDQIACVSVNDPFVMRAWAADQGVAGRVTMIADGNGSFTEAMGLIMDGTGFGLGQRSQRYAAVLQDGTIEWLGVEPGPGLEVSSADSVLAAL